MVDRNFFDPRKANAKGVGGYDPLAIKALRSIAALAPRCSEDECDDNYETKGAHRLATHETKLFGAPVITGSQVASTADKQTNLGDVINAIKQS